MTALNFRIATLNISGGEKTFEEFSHDTQQSRQEALTLLIRRLDADVLCLQEMSQYVDADGVCHSLMDTVNAAGGYRHAFFGETVSMMTHLQVKKDTMAKGIFSDWQNWSKGNAIHSRFPFSRLGDPEHAGQPRNIPLFQPSLYEGTRDTEPRNSILARIKNPPHPFIATLHLTTLKGERQRKAKRPTIEKSQLIRHEQIETFLELVQTHILEKHEPLILAGDFNASQSEFSMAHLMSPDTGFVRLVPENDGPSHAGTNQAIDHIFFYPRDRLIDYSCRMDTSDLSRRASDHLPVVADLQIA